MRRSEEVRGDERGVGGWLGGRQGWRINGHLSDTRPVKVIEGKQPDSLPKEAVHE